jgi:hypothetical protein
MEIASVLETESEVVGDDVDEVGQVITRVEVVIARGVVIPAIGCRERVRQAALRLVSQKLPVRVV